MDGRWMGRLSSGGDELGKTWNVYNLKYVKRVCLMQDIASYLSHPLALLPKLVRPQFHSSHLL